jgi:hypothetical protein
MHREGDRDDLMLKGAEGRTCVFGVLDTKTNEWLVYPKPRGLWYRWRRRRFRRG